MADISTTTVQLATAIGYTSAASITTIGTVTTPPTMWEISPQVGSVAGGTVIRVTGAGWGKSTKIDLLAKGASVCSKVEITKYGEFYCTTKPAVVALGSAMQLKVGGTKYEC
jgi:hypothetical protein